MLVTQAGMAISAALLAWTAFAGVQKVWPIYALAAIAAAFGTFDNPARQALIPTLVPAADLPNAISLNAIMFQTASVVGPAAGGDPDWRVRDRVGVCLQRRVVSLRDRRRAPDARRFPHAPKGQQGASVSRPGSKASDSSSRLR